MSTDIYEPWQNVNNADITHSGIRTINGLAGGEREKSYSELEAENADLRARVAELELALMAYVDDGEG